MSNRLKGISIWGILATLALTTIQAKAYEVTDKLSIGGTLAGAYQYQVLGDSTPDYDDTGRGAVTFQAEFSYSPMEQSEFFY